MYCLNLACLPARLQVNGPANQTAARGSLAARRLGNTRQKTFFTPKLSDSFKSIIDRSGAMWQALSPKGVIPACEARRESFLTQRKIPGKPE